MPSPPTAARPASPPPISAIPPGRTIWSSRPALVSLPGDDGRRGAAAVHIQHASVDERGLVAGEVDRGVRDGLRASETAGRGALHHHLTGVHLTRRGGLHHTGGD